jgi:hypothetical protein
LAKRAADTAEDQLDLGFVKGGVVEVEVGMEGAQPAEVAADSAPSCVAVSEIGYPVREGRWCRGVRGGRGSDLTPRGPAARCATSYPARVFSPIPW